SAIYGPLEFIFSFGGVNMLKSGFEDFFHYIRIERGLADNTLASYRRDLTQYMQYIEKVTQKTDWNEVVRKDIIGFLHKLREDGKSPSTVARTISSIRLFHQFLVRERLVNHDASLHIETPKKERKLPSILTPKEVEALLAIRGNSPLNIRNKAMLELLYATGLRVTELITLTVNDL